MSQSLPLFIVLIPRGLNSPMTMHDVDVALSPHQAFLGPHLLTVLYLASQMPHATATPQHNLMDQQSSGRIDLN